MACDGLPVYADGAIRARLDGIELLTSVLGPANLSLRYVRFGDRHHDDRRDDRSRSRSRERERERERDRDRERSDRGREREGERGRDREHDRGRERDHESLRKS